MFDSINTKPHGPGLIIISNSYDQEISIAADGFWVNGRLVASDRELYHAFRRFFGLRDLGEAIGPVCECGAGKVGGRHSGWCPIKD